MKKEIKLAIVGTTIQGEKGYLPFDKLAAKSKFDVTFFIAGDTSSRPFDTGKFLCKVEHMSPKDQERFAISPIIGWKTPRRRPAAYLRAIETSPDFVLTIDDDNIPSPDYFEKWYAVLTTPKKSVVALKGKGDDALVWHNYLRTSDAPLPTYPRGYPVAFRAKNNSVVKKVDKPIPVEKVGLFQGISLYDPDIDAMPKLVYEKPLRISKIREKNYCLKNIWTPYNAQNTVIGKSLFALPILWPANGRYDDIYASYAYQQLLFNNGLYAHVGDAVNHQDRGIRDLFNADFKLEVEGYVGSHEVWQQIRTIKERDGIAFLKKMMQLPHPQIAREKPFFEAYLKDISKILS